MTTQVMDLARGSGANGLRIDVLHSRDEGGVVGHTADHEGRTKEWLAPAGRLQIFTESRLHIDIQDTERHHHVPALISPWGYSVYRGS